MAATKPDIRRRYSLSPKTFVLTAVALVGITVAGIGERADRRDGRQGRDPFRLFSGPVTLLAVNDVQCPIDNFGNICVADFNGTQLLRWPKGSPNDYVFNSGLQIGGLIEGDAGRGRATPWPHSSTTPYPAESAGRARRSTRRRIPWTSPTGRSTRT